MKPLRSLRTFRGTFEQTFRSHHATIRFSDQRPCVDAFHIPALRKRLPATRIVSRRYQSTDSKLPPSSEPQESSSEAGPPASHRRLTDTELSSQSDADAIAMRKAVSPAYQLWFTCKRCLERSGHTVSKQAYHFGTCVIHCSKCKSQHLISDNLKIFGDTNVTMEEIARQHGAKLRKGRLGADGDVEFYDEEATEKVARGSERTDG